MNNNHIIFGAFIIFLILAPAVAAFEISGEYTEKGQQWLNDHWGENITLGDLARIAYTPENYEKVKANVDPELLEQVWSQPYGWGSRYPWGADTHPECPYGANIWDETGPVIIRTLNFSQKQEMGIENAVLDKSGCRIIGYMDQSITQGEAKSFHRQIPENLDRFTYDLFRQDEQNSLKLSVFTPEGMIGPYYDDDDGIANGRIYLQISRDGGITAGDWYAVVEGDHINGNQQFMLLVL
jgi:hypothetical protein